MPAFSASEWLKRLLNEGEAHFEEAPESEGDAKELAAILAAAHATECLHLPGSEVPFAERTAVTAARLTCDACWLYMNPSEGPLSPALAAELDAPKEIGDHLSADLTLRYLVALHRRAKLRGSDDPLAVEIAGVLRDWPLTGVLADLKEPPTTNPNFGGSAALQMLYAERLARCPQSAWVPVDELARQRAELVFHGLGKLLPAKPAEKSLE